MTDHRFPGPRLRGEHAEATLAQCAELAASRDRRRDGGGDGQGRRRRRDLHLRLFHVPLRRQLCGGGATRPSRQFRHRQAGRPGRSGGGRRHRRLEEDAGRGRHPYHADQGGEARSQRPWPRPHPRVPPSARHPGQHLVLGQSGRRHGADRPPSRHALHHRPSGHPAAAHAAGPAAAVGRPAEGAGARQAPRTR